MDGLVLTDIFDEGSVKLTSNVFHLVRGSQVSVGDGQGGTQRRGRKVEGRRGEEDGTKERSVICIILVM